MSETTGVEREPLHIPAAIEQVTRWLVAADSQVLAVRDTQEEAFRLCEDAERPQHPEGVEFRWFLLDEIEQDGPWDMWMFDGDEHATGYTVTPITIGGGA
ncbi:hypothetical protein AB0F88_39790 [Streptosporangium sp. NPDC023963]|uniref:hypothetical protein n=1 Tax=Streptosporangium sp. NPDC023963 TaxID=3155608 RepID=UPI0034445C3C